MSWADVSFLTVLQNVETLHHRMLHPPDEYEYLEHPRQKLKSTPLKV